MLMAGLTVEETGGGEESAWKLYILSAQFSWKNEMTPKHYY